MKLLTILTATVFSLAVIAPFPTDACSGTAGASAWVTSNTSTAFSSINANNAKSGGYSLHKRLIVEHDDNLHTTQVCVYSNECRPRHMPPC
ncbi:MAG: hypothetical protein OXG97_11235 [Candidatus Poribacteria bacterium]|nr:hypothetical protein [Candidatus Poribacteria bacterium]